MVKNMLTATEENYLKAIYKISERSNVSARTNDIAHHLKTSAASVTDMLQKLAEKEYLHYEKYKGATLTQSGSSIATGLIRRHRLWEVFLHDKLRFSWEKIHDIAEELEHIESDELIERLDAYLDYPKFDPHGDPIPNANGKFTLRSQSLLSELKKGETSRLVGVKSHDSEFLRYLNSIDIKLGTQIEVVTKNSFDHSLVICIDAKETSMITAMVAENLLVKKQ